MIRAGLLAWVVSSLPISFVLGRMFRRSFTDGTAGYSSTEIVDMVSRTGYRSS